MTTDTAAGLTRTYSISKQLRITFTAPPVTRGGVLMLSAEWDPAMPSRLKAGELRRYRKARDDFVAELAEQAGLPALVVEG